MRRFLSPLASAGLKHETNPEVWWTESPVTRRGGLAGNKFTLAAR